MDPSASQRRRGRRAHSNTSQENLVSKDSTSDASPREPTPTAVASRRRQRRQQHTPNDGSRPLPPQATTSDQPFVNQAFVDDERPLPTAIEDDEEEQQNIHHADRLVSHVSKQHRRVVNEVQQQKNKKPKRTTATTGSGELDDDQDGLHEQIREHQEIVSKRVGGTDEENDDHHTIEPLPATMGTARDRSVDQILEMARKSRAGRSTDDDQQSGLGSSRRFGASGETTLQKLLRQRDMRLDATQIGSPAGGDRSTRFDYGSTYDDTRLREIQEKQIMRQHRWQDAAKQVLDVAPILSEQEDFFLKVWPDEKEPTKEIPDTATPSRTEPVTTADNIVDGPPAPPQTDETTAAAGDGATALPEDKQPLLPDSQLEYGELQPAQYQRAERPFEDDDERDIENKKFKYVIGEKLTLQEKLGDGIAQPRSLEDEGIFVGKKPVVPITSVHRTEKRILQESTIDNKPVDRWFGPDGAITSLPDPTKFVPTRPLIDDLFDAALGKEFYKAYIVDSESGSSNDPIGTDRYRMDIDLSSISFFHHHMMNMEQVLATKMKQMYEHYTVRRQQRIVQQLSDKIKALKNAEMNCRTMFEQNRYSDTSLPVELRNRLINYQNELRQTRNQRCNEMKLDRQLLQHLLDTWKKIKELRRSQGYITTPVKLLIKQVSGKKTKHYEQMQQQIEDEIQDEITLADEKYKREKDAYAQVIQKKKLQDIRKKEARKRLNKKKDAEDGTTAYDQTDTAAVTTINDEDILVPEKPEPRKQDEIRTTILTKYQNAIRPADEPDILLELVYSEPISTDTECSALERARRYHLQTSSNILIRILINGKIIADTGAIPLSSEFEARMSQIFPCYVVRTPETIKIELYEVATRRRTALAELYLPVPEPTVTSDNYKLQRFEFSSNALLRPHGQSSAVGAGIPISVISPDIPSNDTAYLNLEGVLNASVAWSVRDGVVLVPPDYATSKAYQNRQMGFGGIRQDVAGMQGVNLSNMKHLIDWIKQSNLDPYDPDNAFLINLVKDYTGASGDSRLELNTLQHFRLLTDDGDEFEQRKYETELDHSLRFKLLQARQEKIPDFRDYQRVPPHDYLVRKEHPVFKNYLLRRQAIAGTDDVDLHHEKRQTRIDNVRRQGERQLRKMRDQVLARSTLTASRKTFQEMVVEESVPNITALRGMIANLYIEPTRPLYPTRRRVEQKKVNTFTLATGREVFILVNLIGAIDLPIRRDALEREKNKTTAQNKTNTDRLTLVRPYVEIQFQKKTYRTSTVDGPNPSWNEELRIPFRPPDNDFDASSLQRCRDILYINVFDQLDVDLPTIERERDQIINKRIARNWLGSVKIPFTNVYVNGRLEGSYRLSVPSPLLGYAREKFTPARSDLAGAQPHSTVLRMFITMDPVLAPPESLQQSFDSTESFLLLRHARDWVETLNKRFPERDFKATVSDINGRSVFIPRFLRPLPLPPNVVNMDEASTTMTTVGGGIDSRVQCQRLARFVSMIPFLADSVVFPGICDIWETSDQFLRTMAGDDEEHAVLLNNYFLTLNKKSWVAMGVSIYSGPCCFVLTKEDGQRHPTCWPVSDGQDSSTMDNWNPIRSIHLLANEENVWANIQQQDLPSRMNFDVNDSKCWRPFFDRSFSRDNQAYASVQPSDLHYDVTRNEDVDILQKHIFEVIRSKMIEWREPNVTRWNWNCQKRLQELVKQKEIISSSGRAASSSETEQDLVELQGTYDIVGFPLQIPYTNIQSIVDTVYSTKMFEHPTNDVEFALAVHIHSYPNNILAVWIYLAHLTKKIHSTI